MTVPFNYIAEGSEATPGLFNSPLSALSASIANLNSQLGSGVTLSVLSDVSTGGGIFTAGPSNLSGVVTIHSNSNVSDYLSFKDSSNARSNYLLGSHIGGTADGLNIYDNSGATMIVSFSKQSIRFWQNVVGPVFDIGGGLFNVKAYGALGNGTGDDTAAIQGAIDAAGLAGGGSVLFPAGIYPISRKANGSCLSVPYSNIELRGDANSVISLIPTPLVTDMIQMGQPIASPSLFSNIAARQLRLNGSGSSEVKGLRGSYIQNLVIDGNEIFNIGPGGLGAPAAIWVEGVSSSQSAVDVAIRANYCHDIGDLTLLTGDGIQVQNTNRVVISGNRTFNTNRGIFIDGANANVSVVGNSVMSSNDNSIRVNPASGGRFDDNRYITISGNVVDRSVRDGCRFNGVFMNISGNVFKNAGQRGIKADMCRSSLIANNVIDSPTQQGIYLEIALESELSGAHQDVSIIGNSVTSAGQEGIRLDGSGWTGNSTATYAKNILIANNVVAHNAAGGILWQDGDDGTIAYNVVVENANVNSGSNKAGIQISNSSNLSVGLGIRVIGNRCYDQRPSGKIQDQGIIVTNTNATGILANVILDGNDVSDTQNKGISIDGAATGLIRPVVIANTRAVNCPTPVNSRSSDILYSIILSSGSAPIFTWSTMTDGSAVQPAMGFNSEDSLGWYRSGASTLALSYGTLGVTGIGSPSGNTVSFATAIKVDGATRTDGPTLRHAGVGNYELRHLGTGTFTIASDNGQLTLSAGTSADALVLQTGAPNNRLIVRSGGSIEIVNQLYVGQGTVALPTLGFVSDLSLAFYNSGTKTIAQSTGTFNLATGGVRLSMRTLAASSVTASAAKTNVAVDEVVFTIGGASGASLLIYSGGTVYGFASSFSAAAS